MKVSDLPYGDKLLEVAGGDFELYPHQAEAIEKMESSGNLIVAVPTAAGKTLIAYAAIMKMLARGMKSLYIVPLKALATEKFNELKILRKTGARVKVATGDYDSSSSFVKDCDVVVCTSEKADSMIRHDPSILYDVGLIVADEAHMVGDESRGPRLENVLTTSRIVNPDVMILALSATISNPGEMCSWLDSEIVISDFRPVRLVKGVIYRDKLYFEDDTREELEGDPVFDAVGQVVKDEGQILLFANSRKRTQELAYKLSVYLKDRFGETELSLETEDDPYVERLNTSLNGGVAFHHAGLSTTVRTQIEDMFRRRQLRAIVATPTLAAGVNLPARCVVIRDITRFQNGRSEYLPTREIFQMLGRAGRPEYDSVGLAYLYAASSRSFDRSREYLLSEVEPTISHSGAASQVRFNSLALISMGLGQTTEDIMNYYNATLYHIQNALSDLEVKVEKSLEFLLENDFVRKRGERFIITKFGKVTSDLYLDPESALILYNYLQEKHDLDHALFKICMCPDMITLHANNNDYPLADHFLDKAGIDDYSEEAINAAKTALILREWINETPMTRISESYNVGPGDVQAVSSSADWISYSLARLAANFKQEIARDMDILNFRIKGGIREDIIPLTLIPGVGRVRARRLYMNGFQTLEAIANSTPEAIGQIYGFSSKLSKDVISSAKRLESRTRGSRT